MTPGDRLVALLRAAKILLREKEIGFAARIRCWFYNKRYLDEGDARLEQMHEQICGVPPQAPKPIADRV